MSRFARFGRFFGEFGNQLKANPVVTAFDRGGWKSSVSSLYHGVVDPYKGRFQQARAAAENHWMMSAVDMPGGGAAIPVKDQFHGAGIFMGKLLGPDAAWMGGGAAAGLGYGAYRRQRGEHVSRRRMMGYALAGGALGAKLGTANMYRMNPDNPFTMAAAAPWRAWQKSRLPV